MTVKSSRLVPGSHAELVYRWKVRQDALGEFSERITRILSDLVSREAGESSDIVAARVYQPVLGPGSEVWEVHLEFRNLETAGRLLDREGEGISAPLWELAGITGGRSESRAPLAELLESSAPLYRTLVLRPVEQKPRTVEAEATQRGRDPSVTDPKVVH